MIFSSRNRATAASLAPFKMAVDVPPRSAHSSASPRQRKVSGSGFWKVSGGQLSRSSGLAGPGVRSGQVRAYWMGRNISALPSWARMAPSSNSTREWTMLSRWMAI